MTTRARAFYLLKNRIKSENRKLGIRLLLDFSKSDSTALVWLATREYWSISRLGKLPASRLREAELGPDLSGLHTIVWRKEGEAGWRRVLGMITEKEEIEKRKRMFSERITRSALI